MLLKDDFCLKALVLGFQNMWLLVRAFSKVSFYGNVPVQTKNGR